MKIFISSDMEGTAGVVDWDQVVVGGHLYDYYTGLLTNEVNAAIEGAMQAGASEFLVNDSHSKMQNLRPDRLAGRARYLSGRVKPMYMMQGLDESFDAVFFVSYHGSMSSKGSTLSHTYFPTAFAEVTLNGQVTGEAGINALVALGYGVPVVLITGDVTTAEELRPFAPNAVAAVVKDSVTRFAANSLHPEEACEVIREAAERAIRGLSDAALPPIAVPTTMGIKFRTSDYCDLASRISGVTREGDLEATITCDDPLELYQTFITVVLLCRGLVE
jgi:D-amino peptidase